MFTGVGDHHALIEVSVSAADDEGPADLTEALVGNPDDRDVGHAV